MSQTGFNMNIWTTISLSEQRRHMDNHFCSWTLDQLLLTVDIWTIIKFFYLNVHWQFSRLWPLFIDTRDQLIWQIEEFHYPTLILGMIYHIRADAFRIFGLWRSHSRAIQPNFGVKLLFMKNSLYLDRITFSFQKSSSFTILHWITLTFGSIPLWKVVYWNPIIG